MERSVGKLWNMVALLLVTAYVPAAAVCGGEACDSCDAPVSCSDAACCDLSCCDALACDACCRDSGALGLGCFDFKCLDRLACELDSCGLIQPSDRCFDDFISPMINFVFFEDPRTVTELRPIYVSHEVPGTLGTGTIQLFAAQFRIALSDRLSLIAVKDGYIVDSTSGVIDTLIDDGWADVSAGLKYNLIRDTCRGTLVSTGFTYEIPMGSPKALQNLGDGEFHLFGTAGQRLAGGNAHWLTSFGFRLPVDDEIQTTSVHWSNHFDVRLTKQVYAVTEVAWWHWTDDAEGAGPLGVAGQDLFNLPANDVEGNDLVTQNVGFKYKPNRNVEAGIAYEFPLTSFNDVIEDRLQLDLILRY